MQMKAMISRTHDEYVAYFFTFATVKLYIDENDKRFLHT